MKLLDTNICIYIIKKKPPEVLKRFEAYDLGDLAVSSVTVAELYFGAYNSTHVEKNLQIVEHFLVPFEILDFNAKAAIEYGRIKAYLRQKGQMIGELDMQIAAVARVYHTTLITNNLKEFERIDGLSLENWV